MLTSPCAPFHVRVYVPHPHSFALVDSQERAAAAVEAEALRAELEAARREAEVAAQLQEECGGGGGECSERRQY